MQGILGTNQKVGLRSLGFGVWGLGFRVWGLGFGVSGLKFRLGAQGLGFRVWSLGFGSGFRGWEFKCLSFWDLLIL